MIKINAIIVLAFAVLPSNAWWLDDPRVEPHEEVTNECLQFAAWGRCEFYSCLERRFPCGHRGYAVHVGQHFCRKFIDKMDDFTTEGNQWMNRTSVCLTNALLPVYQSYASRCGDIREDGANAIVTCNDRVEPDGQDFCSFVRDNTDEYQSIFGLDEIQRLVRLGRPGAVARLFVDGASCGADMLQERFYDLTGAFNDMAGSLMEHVDGIRDRWNSLWN